MKKEIDEIKEYPANLEILWYDSLKKETLSHEDYVDDHDAHGVDTIMLDGLQGVRTKEEWREELTDYSSDSQDKILSALSRATNNPFFR